MTGRDPSVHGRNVLVDAPILVRYGAEWTRKRLLAQRRVPSVIVRGGGDRYGLHYDAEQAPNRDSRVYLGNGRDPFGQLELVVD